MGEREDLVRQRLGDEQRRKQEKAALKAQTDVAELAQLNEEYEELITAFDEEGKRIAEQLKDADWSQAVLKTFVYPKKHWWSRKRAVEYACLKFATHIGKGYNGWIRSDDWLLLGDRTGTLWRPCSLFKRRADATKVYLARDTVREMHELLDELKAYIKAA